MKTYPLHSVSLEEAKQLQFRVVDAVTRHFDGRAVLSLGDLGVSEGLNRPVATHKAEQVIAEVFGAEDATLVRGAGTGAIRWGLTSFMHNGGKLLVHKAPIYPTTKVTIETMNLRPVEADYNTPGEIARVLRGNPDIGGALVQVTRQKPDDRYDLAAVIGEIHAACPALPVLTDDNYAVMKIPQIGVQCGASLSSFSSFKLLGPEGVGVLTGSHELIERVRAWNYSGGSQVQGHEAMAVLRGLIYAPVALAVESEVADELVRRLCAGEVAGVKDAFLANAQSKVLLVEFDEEIAPQVLKAAVGCGGAPHPVGSESKYEFVPMFYRLSGTFRQQDPALERRMIRINPMRGGADTVIRILSQAIKEAKEG